MQRKYLYSLGVSYYAEKEMQRLEKQASKGWQFVKMNRLGFLIFKKAPAQNKKFAVDFYTGEQSTEEIEDYLEMYQASGWSYLSNYKKRYYYFMADPKTPTIFSDKVSYMERLNLEQKWLVKNSFKMTIIGLIITIATHFLLSTHVLQQNFATGLLFGAGLALLLMPFIYFISGHLMNLRYKDRSDYYNNPEEYAKKQRFWLDTFFSMLFGAILVEY